MKIVMNKNNLFYKELWCKKQALKNDLGLLFQAT